MKALLTHLQALDRLVKSQGFEELSL
jgi:hypothetical protein